MSDQLKLLAAKMREGASKTPQCKKNYAKWLASENYATCAFGAAAVACGWNPGDLGTPVMTLVQECTGVDFGYDGNGLSEMMAIHPGTIEEDTLEAIIVDLNDEYGWSRERIAEWLESL